MYDPRLVEAIADLLRAMEIGGKPVFLDVYTEEVDGYIHLDIEGVDGELMFLVEDKAESVPGGGNMYRVSHDAIESAPGQNVSVPYGVSTIEKLLAVDSEPPLPTGHTYGLPRLTTPGQVYPWKPIYAYHERTARTEQSKDTLKERLQELSEGASRQWLVSNGFLPIDADPME